MAATDLSLITPNILILINKSASGLVGTTMQPIMSFGQVKSIYIGATTVAVNDYVLFESTKGIFVVDGFDTYILIDEQYILAKEFPA